jgi:hypothetical protein
MKVVHVPPITGLADVGSYAREDTAVRGQHGHQKEEKSSQLTNHHESFRHARSLEHDHAQAIIATRDIGGLALASLTAAQLLLRALYRAYPVALPLRWVSGRNP